MPSFLRLQSGGKLLLQSGGGDALLLAGGTPTPPTPPASGGGGFEDFHLHIRARHRGYARLRAQPPVHAGRGRQVFIASSVVTALPVGLAAQGGLRFTGSSRATPAAPRHRARFHNTYGYRGKARTLAGAPLIVSQGYDTRGNSERDLLIALLDL